MIINKKIVGGFRKVMINCPLIDQEIDIGKCTLTVDVCDGCVKESALPEKITNNLKWRDICCECEYHEN